MRITAKSCIAHNLEYSFRPPPPLPTQIQNTHHHLALNDLFFRFMLLDLLQSLHPLVLVVYHLVSQSRDFKSLYSDLFFECFILCREV